MKKNMLNLIAVSMVALLAGGLNAARCSSADNTQKKVILVNDTGENLGFVVLDTASPSTAGMLVTGNPVFVSPEQTKQVPYCKDNFPLLDIVGVGFADGSPQTHEAVSVPASVVVQEDGSYNTQLMGDMFGGITLNFTDLFKQLRGKKSGSVIITVGPSTAGLIAKAQVK